MDDLVERLLPWYDAHARNLPWRDDSATPWAVMVSEFMLQQTPVVRVLPVFDEWLARWPTPGTLAVEAPGEAVRAWGRLGYPRRALRLHAAAIAIETSHAGVVPSELDELRALPGVGDYTAAAVAVFAFGKRHAVLDTNVRRVLTRVLGGSEHPSRGVARSERAEAESLLPADDATAASWSIALMELGALVCRASAPRCDECPLRERCAWRAAGFPAYDGPPRRVQRWAGTDRQCRGRLLGVVRDAPGSVHPGRLRAAWPDDEQRERCLRSLLDDGLLVVDRGDRVRLP